MSSGINGARAAGGNPRPPVRTNVTSWSIGSARRNERFLMTVEWWKLDGEGVCFTLTVAAIPASSAEWCALKKALWQRLERLGLIRLHHVTEWQERGAPHLHGMAFFPRWNWRTSPGVPPSVRLSQAWLELTAHLGTSERGQHVVPLDMEGGPQGWFAYLAKHAGRGLTHYQRERGKLPAGWKKTGRMWGIRGDWPTSACELEVSHRTLDQLRRAFHRLEVARVRDKLCRAERFGSKGEAAALRRRLARVRRFRKRGDRTSSHVQPLKAWADPGTVVLLIRWACGFYDRTPDEWDRPRPWSDKPPRPAETSRIGAGRGGVAGHKWDHPSRHAHTAAEGAL